ncbi:MAG: amidohydrolase [Crocinitomicaceae bacterium]|nr:amidohydrolase [Crocinitomicaceae bacterium]
MKYFLILITGLTLSSCYQGKEADLIVHNAVIYSCDDEFHVYEAMAIKDGKILELGPEREIMNGYKCDNIIDNKKRPVYPGFHDAHCHFGGYAELLNKADLVGTTSFEEMVSKVVEHEQKTESSWIQGRGWDQTLWPGSEFPTNDTFNIIFPDKPMILQRVDGHAALVNQAALDIAGYTAETQIIGGEIKVVNGKCTGLLLDNAVDSLVRSIPILENGEKLNLLQHAEKDLFAAGLTSINDAGILENERDQFIEWYKNGDLRIKDYAMLFPTDENLKFASTEGVYKKGNLHIGSFKILSDGAMGSRGACLLAPYSDDPENYGFLLATPQEIKDVAELAAEIGYQVNTHCIGDSANRTMLKIYEEVIGSKADHRWKIEHAQVLDEKDFEFFELYKIIPSVQPTHCTSDMRWAEDRLGSHRVKHAYAYKKLLEKAGMLALGTDFPVERIFPLETFYAAVSRMDRNGYPKEGFQMQDAISREDALRGMTIWPAYSNFENHHKGSLEAGKDADFVILDKDIMKIEVADILKTFIVSTYLDGQLVYSGE